MIERKRPIAVKPQHNTTKIDTRRSALLAEQDRLHAYIKRFGTNQTIDARLVEITSQLYR